MPTSPPSSLSPTISLDEEPSQESRPTVQLSKICSICDNLFNIPREHKLTKYCIHTHHTLPSLKLSAQHCDICALINAQLSPEHIALEQNDEKYTNQPLKCYQFPSYLYWWNIVLYFGDYLDHVVAHLQLIAIPGIFPFLSLSQSSYQHL
jgi:hypothetical protein